MSPKSIVLDFTAEKKHSVRYDYVGPEQKPIITTLYVSKSCFDGSTYPKHVRVAIESLED